MRSNTAVQVPNLIKHWNNFRWKKLNRTEFFELWRKVSWRVNKRKVVMTETFFMLLFGSFLTFRTFGSSYNYVFLQADSWCLVWRDNQKPDWTFRDVISIFLLQSLLIGRFASTLFPATSVVKAAAEITTGKQSSELRFYKCLFKHRKKMLRNKWRHFALL